MFHLQEIGACAAAVFAIALSLASASAVHEFGHFLVARRNGVAVSEVSLGFGPLLALLGTDANGTRYTLRWLQLGGFCHFTAAKDVASDSALVTGKLYSTVSATSRFWIAAAGPAINLILGVGLVIAAALVARDRGIWSVLGAVVNDISSGTTLSTCAMVAGHAMSAGLPVYLCYVALISFSLAILNLLPLPPLDGARMGFTLAEIIMRRPLLSPRVEQYVSLAGVTLLVVLNVAFLLSDPLRAVLISRH